MEILHIYLQDHVVARGNRVEDLLDAAAGGDVPANAVLRKLTRILTQPGSPDALLHRGPSDPYVPLVAAYGSSKPQGRSGVEVCWFFLGAGCPALAVRVDQ